MDGFMFFNMHILYINTHDIYITIIVIAQPYKVFIKGELWCELVRFAVFTSQCPRWYPQVSVWEASLWCVTTRMKQRGLSLNWRSSSGPFTPTLQWMVPGLQQPSSIPQNCARCGLCSRDSTTCVVWIWLNSPKMFPGISLWLLSFFQAGGGPWNG